MFKNRLMLGYVVLVGVPLVFLLLTLRAGRALTAPAAVSGDWMVQGATGAAPAPALPPAMSIDQTGDDLLIQFRDAGKTIFAAKLTGMRISGTVPPSITSGGVGKRTVRLAAALNAANKRTMDGTLSFEGCQDCAPVPFHATKQGREK